MMKSIFYNQDQKRIRSGWRILLFLLLFWSFASLIFLFKSLFPAITRREFIADYSLLVIAILAFSTSIATLIARKYFDKRNILSLGLKLNKRTFKDLLFGFLLSALMAALFFLTLLLFGLIELEGIEMKSISTDMQVENGFVGFMSVFSIGAMLLLLLETILVGYWEELAFRGYLLQNMADGLGMKAAIVISCIIYGIIHASNPNAGLLSSCIIIGFGFLRIFGLLSTKQLWLSMGMHIGWNFFQGPIFGFAASGHKKATLISHSFTSNKDYLTGGEFGPEGSILIIPILIIAILIMHWYGKKYHHNQNTKLLDY